MKIYLIRHGETTGDIEDRYGGDYEDHLSKKGIEESKELSQKLKNKHIEVIYHSPRIRAKETAKIVNQIIKCELKEINALRERNAYGILTGMIKSEAKEKYPKEVEKLQKDKLNHNVKNSEDYLSFKNRIIKTFNELINSNYENIVIISHGGPISCFIREVLKLGEFKKLGNCAILEFEKDNSKLKLINLDGAILENEN